MGREGGLRRSGCIVYDSLLITCLPGYPIQWWIKGFLKT